MKISTPVRVDATKAAQVLKKHIRDIPDFPTKGILFRDVTPLLRNGKAFRSAIALLAERYRKKRIHAIVAIESRGLIFGAALAHVLGVGIVPVRKQGKLPHKTYRASYTLEYGASTLEIHCDALAKGDRVVVVDDLLATGGTLSATVELVRRCGGSVIEIACLIELTALNGREKLEPHAVTTFIRY